MNNFKKLFLYAFATGMERFRDSQGALKYIDDILTTPEEILYQEVLESIQQAHRVNSINKDGTTKELAADIITLEDVKRIMDNKIKQRGHTN